MVNLTSGAGNMLGTTACLTMHKDGFIERSILIAQLDWNFNNKLFTLDTDADICNGVLSG